MIHWSYNNFLLLYSLLVFFNVFLFCIKTDCFIYSFIKFILIFPFKFYCKSVYTFSFNHTILFNLYFISLCIFIIIFNTCVNPFILIILKKLNFPVIRVCRTTFLHPFIWSQVFLTHIILVKSFI